MDPDLALMNCRNAARAWLETDEPDRDTEWAETLAESFLALDEWISRGGFLPDFWNKNRG